MKNKILWKVRHKDKKWLSKVNLFSYLWTIIKQKNNSSKKRSPKQFIIPFDKRDNNTEKYWYNNTKLNKFEIKSKNVNYLSKLKVPKYIIYLITINN